MTNRTYTPMSHTYREEQLPHEAIIKTLRASELARGMTVEQLEKLASIASVRFYDDSDLICEIYERNEELYVIEEGTVETWFDPSSTGEEGLLRRVATLPAGETVGEIALVDDGVRSARLQAGPRGARLIVFNGQQFLQLCDADHDFGYAVMRNLSTTLARRLRLRRAF